MAHQVRLVKNGITYVYESTSYWDSEKKQPRSKRKLIGHIDLETGELVPNRRYDAKEKYARTYEIGTFLLFDTISHKVGLSKILRKVFSRDADRILTCAYYMVSEGKALSRCEQWSAGSRTPYGGRLGDQRISELLIRLDKDAQKAFFKEWVSINSETDNYALDITSISSYSEEIDIVRAGYNRDHENLEQINVALLIGSTTFRPLFYEILPGNINDRSSLERFVGLMDAMGFERFRIVMDKGFCTKYNIDMLYQMNMKFILPLTKSLNFTMDAITEVKNSIVSLSNYHRISGSSVYVSSSLKKWNGHRCYTHVYYDETKMENDRKRFMQRLLRCRDLLENGETIPQKDQSFCERYFTVKETPKRGRKVIPNDDLIEEFRQRDAGYLVLVSNHEKDPVRALEIYRAKETAESGFDDIKNDFDLDRLGVHSERAMDGKMFIGFIALIIKMELNRVVYASDVLKERTVQELIDEMKLLRATYISGTRKPFLTERTKLQKQVISEFSVDMSVDLTLPDADDPEFVEG